MNTFFEIQKSLIASNFSGKRELYSEIDFTGRLVGVI
jgi:hypothetical protein